MERNFVTIVSGLPRSGTSMMMQAIEAGGVPALMDNVRKADDDNPKGYYEFEPVKKTKEDPSWLETAGGSVVKMVYKLLYDLPQDRPYKVVFMQRNLEEVHVSQKKMLNRLGRKGGGVEAEKMIGLYRSQLQEFEKWIAEQNCFQVLYVNYKDIIDNTPEQMQRVSEFLGGLDVDAMCDAVDPSLYRNRQ